MDKCIFLINRITFAMAFYKIIYSIIHTFWYINNKTNFLLCFLYYWCRKKFFLHWNSFLFALKFEIQFKRELTKCPFDRVPLLVATFFVLWKKWAKQYSFYVRFESLSRESNVTLTLAAKTLLSKCTCPQGL